MSFHPDGKRLVSVGLDNDHSICLWDWAKGLCLATTRGHKDKIFAIGVNPSKPTQVRICGCRCLFAWLVGWLVGWWVGSMLLNLKLARFTHAR